MAGIYIHVPFCKKICFYCDFYKTSSISFKHDYIKSLLKEIEIKQNFLSDKNIETIYFGGGTPSLLRSDEINLIYNELCKYFNININSEITLEANPDDLTEKYTSDLQNTSINRISIGIQSFFDDDLKFMNRRHTVLQAEQAVNNCLLRGFTNLSGDLIYGLPKMTTEKWQKNLEKFFMLPINHLSAYHLTIEEKTVFNKYLKNNKIKEQTQEQSEKFFKILMQFAEKNNFIHYEISNFAKQNYFSKHNSAYWQQKQYLGLGPSAHSYNSVVREWNVSDIKKYTDLINSNQIFYNNEIIDLKTKYNEYVMTSLRTIWGIDLDYVKNIFGKKYYEFIILESEKYIKTNVLNLSNKKLTLNKSGKFISDKIISDLFYLQ